LWIFYTKKAIQQYLGPVQTMPKSRGEASLLWTKLCREEKSLG
jgi:hypothetical protein